MATVITNELQFNEAMIGKKVIVNGEVFGVVNTINSSILLDNSFESSCSGMIRNTVSQLVIDHSDHVILLEDDEELKTITDPSEIKKCEIGTTVFINNKANTLTRHYREGDYGFDVSKKFDSSGCNTSVFNHNKWYDYSFTVKVIVKKEIKIKDMIKSSLTSQIELMLHSGEYNNSNVLTAIKMMDDYVVSSFALGHVASEYGVEAAFLLSENGTRQDLLDTIAELSLKETIYHYRNVEDDGTVKGNGGMTVVFTNKSGEIHIGVALCSNKDKFNKKKGVEIARSRMMKTSITEVPSKHGFNPEMVSKIDATSWELLNRF